MGESRSSSTTHSSSFTQGASQTIAPVMEDRYSGVVSLERQEYELASDLKAQPQRNAIVKTPENEAVPIVTSVVHSTLSSKRRIKRFTQRVLEKSPYTNLISVVEADIEARLLELKEKASGTFDGEDEPDDYRS